jgi:acyl carrier protein phosphodiesterase
VNFLAHVYLSGDNFSVALGNLIADQIKRSDVQNFPLEVQKGISLHRAIDEFTDAHPLFKNCVTTLFPTYRHYSRVIVDMYFDHFLAVHWEDFHSTSLNDFSNNFYNALHQTEIDFPDKLKRFIHALTTYNWFEQYSSVSGLRDIMAQMDKRTRFDSNLAGSTAELIEKYPYFEQRFLSFIKPLIAFSQSKLSEL